MNVLDYVKAFNEFLWNSFLMYALLGVGIFYTVYLGFPQIRHLNLAFKYAFGPIFKKRKPGETKVNSFQALATAVAAQPKFNTHFRLIVTVTVLSSFFLWALCPTNFILLEW